MVIKPRLSVSETPSSTRLIRDGGCKPVVKLRKSFAEAVYLNDTMTEAGRPIETNSVRRPPSLPSNQRLFDERYSSHAYACVRGCIFVVDLLGGYMHCLVGYDNPRTFLLHAARCAFFTQIMKEAMEANNCTSLSKQYQHYIPQFLLRNFSLAQNEHVESTDPSQVRLKRRKEAVINCVNLSAENPTIEEKPVRSILGKYDMYDNDRQSSEKRRHIERKLSNLESKASELFHRILDVYQDGHRGLWLSRDEKNLMRKFLFVMKYRGPTFYERY